MARHKALMDQLEAFYGDLKLSKLDRLSELYVQDVSFTDPILTLQGRDQLRDYLAHGLGNAQACEFSFLTQVADAEHIFVAWEMRLQHPALAKGRELLVPGSSHFQLAAGRQKIQSHTDYYDLGAMVYENVPILSFLVNKVRTRLEPV